MNDVPVSGGAPVSDEATEAAWERLRRALTSAMYGACLPNAEERESIAMLSDELLSWHTTELAQARAEGAQGALTKAASHEPDLPAGVCECGAVLAGRLMSAEGKRNWTAAELDAQREDLMRAQERLLDAGVPIGDLERIAATALSDFGLLAPQQQAADGDGSLRHRVRELRDDLRAEQMTGFRSQRIVCGATADRLDAILDESDPSEPKDKP